MEMLVDTFGILDHNKTEKINLEELQSYLRNNFNYDFHLQIAQYGTILSFNSYDNFYDDVQRRLHAFMRKLERFSMVFTYDDVKNVKFVMRLHHIRRKFQKLFGSHGLMNLEEFCDSLGLDVSKVRLRLGYQNKNNDNVSRTLPMGASGLNKIQGADHAGDDLMKQEPSLPIVTVRSLQTDPDLPKDMEQKIIEIIVGEFRKGTAEKEIPERIKQQLDAQMSPLWHVLMIRGDYWSSHSYEPPNYITLGFGKYLITCWKTPIPQDI